ncbi:magnesium transporter [Faecalibaculum rodentium]|uniref:magnesium transporter n=1 Tax=Faecalibaculum rodentium TaxID=1702221 RepID=UPI0026086138|nr:magnesium transporter [Faecalibaculum rodentium]
MQEEPRTIEAEAVRQRPDYEAAIVDAVRTSTAPRLLAMQLENYHAGDIADAFFRLTLPEREKLYRILKTDTLSEILEYLDEEERIRFINELTLRKAAAVLNRLEPDQTGDLIQSLVPEKQALLMELLDSEMRADIALIDSYDEDLIGSRMTTNFVEVPRDVTVKEAMNLLVKQAADNDNITTIYSYGNDHMYAGAVDLKDLIIARNDTPLEDILVASYPYVYGSDAVETVIDDLRDYNEDSIPVLGSDNRVLGVITTQSLLEALDQEMGEDYARFAGLMAEEDLEETLFVSLKKRLPWLLFLLALGLIVSWVVSLFEAVVAQIPLVLAFQSLILGMSGNVGTQSLGVTIRVLMDDELTGKEKRHLVAKEARVGFVNGLIMGSMAFVFLGLYILAAKHQTVAASFTISACIAVSLWLAMIVSSLTGTTIPIFFKKIGVDPAVASGPLITTINDLCAVILFYGLVWLFLIRMLGM